MAHLVAAGAMLEHDASHGMPASLPLSARLVVEWGIDFKICAARTCQCVDPVVHGEPNGALHTSAWSEGSEGTSKKSLKAPRKSAMSERNG